MPLLSKTTTNNPDLKFGLCTPDRLWQGNIETQQRLMARIAQANFDHVYMADHVSFRNGSGTDGFIEVAALSRLHESLGVMISVYLLALRHPMPVARQIATMHTIAPGRLTLGVGIGGEDRHEIEVCGVDPKTRGRRTNECLAIIRDLMHGEPIDFSGEFFELEQARIQPAIDPAVPILVGGRSDAARHRTAQYGDGWVGVWCSPQRYANALALVDEQAAEFGRRVNWLHGYQPWVGVADTKEEARELVSTAMEKFYRVPFKAFEKYTPYGRPDEVAEQLAPYIAAGCRLMNLKVVARSDDEEITGGIEVQQSLRAMAGQ